MLKLVNNNEVVNVDYNNVDHVKVTKRNAQVDTKHHVDVTTRTGETYSLPHGFKTQSEATDVAESIINKVKAAPNGDAALDANYRLDK